MDEFVDEFLDFIRIERNFARNTIEAYARDLANYITFLDDHNVTTPNQISPALIQDFIFTLNELGLAEASSARKLSAVKSFHKYLLGEQYSEFNPAETVTIRRSATEPPAVIEIHEMEHLLSLPETDSPLGLRDKSMLEFMYATGARISEVLNLHRSDYFPEEYFCLLYTSPSPRDPE